MCCPVLKLRAYLFVVGVADAKDDEKAVPKEVVFSTKLWALYVDLEISLGTIKVCQRLCYVFHYYLFLDCTSSV